MKLEGTGIVAITTHYDPLTLHVSADHPVTTDPNATVAWSGALVPEFKADVSLKTFLGRGSGESIQMSFCGEGFVVVQPYEKSTSKLEGRKTMSSPFLARAACCAVILLPRAGPVRRHERLSGDYGATLGVPNCSPLGQIDATNFDDLHIAWRCSW